MPPSSSTVSVHLVEASSDGRSARVRAVTEPVERWGIGGGIVSTAAPAAAAVRLLARGAIEARGVVPPERCVDADELFAELEPRGCRVEVEVPQETRP
jgi:saccharopine dehydrogenase-like NADP-dependent oxidoreductase